MATGAMVDRETRHLVLTQLVEALVRLQDVEVQEEVIFREEVRLRGVEGMTNHMLSREHQQGLPFYMRNDMWNGELTVD
jgi:hypothetical protein